VAATGGTGTKQYNYTLTAAAPWSTRRVG
jgi:hypothetical protein